MTSGPIRIQSTPNPNARKFILPNVQFERSTNYASSDAAAAEPCIDALFGLDGIYNVLTAQNFVTVNKQAHVPWETLETEICAILNQHYLSPPASQDSSYSP